MLLASVVAQCGTQVCLDITVRDFTNIIAFQYSINWDPTHLNAATVSNFGISDLGNSNFNSSVNGQLRVGWDDSSIQGVTLANDIVLFTLCLDVVSMTPVNSTITFTNMPLPIEIVDANGELGMFEFQNGMVQIGCGGLTEDVTQFQISNYNVLDNISLYPNPVSSELTVQLAHPLSEDAYIQLFDTWGRLVYTQTVAPNRDRGLNLPIGHLTSGLYLFEMKVGENRVSKRILKRWKYS